MRKFLRILWVSLVVDVFIGPAIVTLPFCLLGGLAGIALGFVAYPVGVAVGAPHAVTLGIMYAVVYFYSCRYFSKTTVINRSFTKPLGGVIGLALGVIGWLLPIGITTSSITPWIIVIPAGICGYVIPGWLPHEEALIQAPS